MKMRTETLCALSCGASAVCDPLHSTPAPTSTPTPFCQKITNSGIQFNRQQERRCIYLVGWKVIPVCDVCWLKIYFLPLHCHTVNDIFLIIIIIPMGSLCLYSAIISLYIQQHCEMSSYRDSLQGLSLIYKQAVQHSQPSRELCHVCQIFLVNALKYIFHIEFQIMKDCVITHLMFESYKAEPEGLLWQARQMNHLFTKIINSIDTNIDCIDYSSFTNKVDRQVSLCHQCRGESFA